MLRVQFVRRLRECRENGIEGKGMKKEMNKMKERLESSKRIGSVFLLVAVLTVSAPAFAARPLITDDTGTAGKGNAAVELGVGASSWKETVEGVRVKEKGTEASGVFIYGVSENVDVVAGFPYAWSKVREDGTTITNEHGIPDISLELKWRFFEKNGFGLAVKPCMTLPTGDHKKGFGAGRVTYGLTFIASRELGPFGLHLNAGYVRNENRVDERKNLWSASVAATYEAVKGLNLVGNMGLECNADPVVGTAPAFALAGFNYAINDRIALDAGYKLGLNKQEMDRSIIAGVTLSF